MSSNHTRRFSPTWLVSRQMRAPAGRLAGFTAPRECAPGSMRRLRSASSRMLRTLTPPRGKPAGGLHRYAPHLSLYSQFFPLIIILTFFFVLWRLLGGAAMKAPPGPASRHRRLGRREQRNGWSGYNQQPPQCAAPPTWPPPTPPSGPPPT